MHESRVEYVPLGSVCLLEQMVSRWHAVALIPICSPLTEDWESWGHLEFDLVYFPKSIRRRNVSNKVPIV